MEKEKKNSVHELLTSWHGLHHQDGRLQWSGGRGLNIDEQDECERRAFAGPHNKYDE